MKENIVKLLNEQITEEFFSANLYLSMSAYFEEKGLRGFAHWMRQQFHEEQEHGLKIYDFLLDRGELVELGALAKPEHKFESPLEVMKMALAHEKKITSMINNIMETAVEEKDFATENLMRWFVDEQVEEESSVDAIVQQLEMVGNSGHALYMIDKDVNLLKSEEEDV